MCDRYFIWLDNRLEEEVSKDQYVAHERMAGFHNTMGQPEEPATAAFSGLYYNGRIEYDSTHRRCTGDH